MEIKNDQLRQDYLERQWTKYPDAMNLKMAGRIVAIDRGFLILMAGVKKTRHAVKTIKNWPQIQPVLIAGDIIGIQKNGHCVLLTPNRLTSGDSLTSLKIAEKIQSQQRWNQFITQVNRFFTSRKFLSVGTPSLVENPGPEASIDVFKTEFKNGRAKSQKYLITSPELHLKKIVAETLSPVYEITKVYRNNEHSPKHQPEFWMLEWYRPFADLNDITQDVKGLVLFLITNLKIKIKKPIFESTTFRDVLKHNYRFEFSPQTSSAELEQVLARQKIYFTPGMGLDDLFTLVNLEMVETKIDKNLIVFLNKYPPYAAALAKLDADGWAQRFEVYWRDLELGNAFYELNDPDIQENRFREDNAKKQKNGLEPLPIDEEFLNCLRRGLPPTAGISIGLERLFMALYQETEIKNLKWFSPV